ANASGAWTTVRRPRDRSSHWRSPHALTTGGLHQRRQCTAPADTPPGSPGSPALTNDPAPRQLGDLRLADAEPEQDLARVLAQQRAGARQRDGRARQARRGAGRLDRARLAMWQLDDEASRPDLLVGDRLIDAIEHAARHAGVLQQAVPVGAGPRDR